MAQRYTRADVSVYSLGGSSKLGELQSFDINTEFTEQDGRTLTQRHQSTNNTKRRNTFSARHYFNDASRPSNLDVTLFQIGSDQLQTKMRSGSIRATTTAPRGDAVADPDEFLNADGTDVEVTGLFMVSNSADAVIIEKLMDGNIRTAAEATVSITVNGQAFVCPMKVRSCRQTFQVGDVQTYELTLTMKATTATNGGITANFSGRTIWASILTGTAVVAVAITTKASGGLSIAGNALITSASLDISNDALINDNYEFQMQGTPTVTVTA